ncbi:MAG: alpha/beta hydrolase [Pseudohongiellaceae bacterium]
MSQAPKQPGRLGNPNLTLRDDPRADPRMIQAMEQLGLLDAAPIPISAESGIDEVLAFCDMAEEGYEMLNNTVTSDWPELTGVVRETAVIKGVDDNDITLYIHRPERHANQSDEKLPGILHIHGGGMVLMSAAGSLYDRWRGDLAATGMVVVGVEFRNGGGKLGPHPFPAGLNDCASALAWMNENKASLGISGIVVSGESGGGNLSLATCLKAKQDNKLTAIDGIYAQCPNVSNRYLDKDPALPSLFENDELGLSCSMMAALFKLYDPEGTNATNPLAWPLHASQQDMQGLPPHFISVCELDPLRDEGIAYTRALVEAGVTASCRTINGVTHAGDISYRAAMPEVYEASIRDIKGFAESVCAMSVSD